MKVAILSESPADEAALRELVAGVLGDGVHFTAPGLRARGWPQVGQLLPAVIRHLHFNTDADALVVVAGSVTATVTSAWTAPAATVALVTARSRSAVRNFAMASRHSGFSTASAAIKP